MHTPLVFIDGDQGTTGLQIHARLQGRQDVRLLTLPHAERKDPQRRAEAINDADIALLCLPDDAAREAVAAIHNPAVRVIDASSAHRTTPGWVYGLPELDAEQAERIARAKRVSNPGCYPTGAIALLRPLIQAGLLPADYPLSIHAISGYSGVAGRRWNFMSKLAPSRCLPFNSMAWNWPTSMYRRSSDTPGSLHARCSCRVMATTARASR